MLLALETSSPQCTLALLQSPTKVLGEISFDKSAEFSERTTQVLHDLLQKTGVELSQIDEYAVGLGPGRFTGVRIGVNIVRTLSYVFKKPVLAVHSLRILAEPALSSHNDVWVLVNAHKEMVFAAHYKNQKEDVAPVAWPAKEVPNKISSDSVILGDAYEIFKQDWSARLPKGAKVIHQPLYPQAQDLGKIAHSAGRVFEPEDWKSILPLYIRDSEAEENLRRGLLKPLKKL